MNEIQSLALLIADLNMQVRTLQAENSELKSNLPDKVDIKDTNEY